METAKIILMQILVMAVLAAIGFLLFRYNKITRAGSKTIGNILIYVSLPIIIFRGFLTDRTAESMTGLGISALAAFIVLVAGMVISHFLCSKDYIADFASCFSNPGFFGLPLIIASISEGAVFYVASFIGFLNVFQWTYGVFLMTKNKKDISVKRIITAPTMIGFMLGLLFFFAGIPVPDFVKNILDFGAGLNTPLAMFTIGVYLAQTNPAGMFRRLSNYKVAALRNVLLPLVSFAIICLIPSEFNEVKLAVLIAASCPVGSNIAVLAEMNDKDYPYAVETVVISTLLSVVTVPLIVLLATTVWGM